jgi:hypothetical protein
MPASGRRDKTAVGHQTSAAKGSPLPVGASEGSHRRARRPGPTLRVSQTRPVRAGPRSPVRCGEAAARPLWQGRRVRCTGTRFCSPRSGAPEAISTCNSAPFMSRNVVTNPYFDWANDRPPRTPYHKTVIYEAHVRGPTLRHPEVPPGQRGTYAGLACPVIIDHLTGLGVTAVELMPVHQFIWERQLAAGGRSNYWGLQHDRFPRAAQRLLVVHRATWPCHRVHVDGQGAARGGHRGDLGRRLQPYGRGRRLRPYAIFPRHRQRRILPAC